MTVQLHIGLNYLVDVHEMRINAAKEIELRALNLHGGIREFAAPLGKIYLPQDRNQRPRLEFIRRARTLRAV